MKNILVVDDEADMLVIWKDILYSLSGDIHVDFASNGRDGLNFFKENQYDLIITDFKMPVMNGWEFIQNVKALDHSKNVPIVLFTAFLPEFKEISEIDDVFFYEKPGISDSLIRLIKLVLVKAA